jgi:beta-N-acetylhexosaminidase
LDRRIFLLSGTATSLLPGLVKASTKHSFGHLLISGFRGTAVGEAEVDKVCEMLRRGQCAGVILLKRNCRSPEQLFMLIQALRDSAGELTPVISIDQEGGQVARLSSANGFLDWDSAHNIARSAMSESELFDYWSARALQLAKVGINMNFAPVIDLNINPDNPIIGKLGRSFGQSSDEVVRFAEIFIRAHRAAGVKTSLKHFPGHGSSGSDSHQEAVDVSKIWKPSELDPYKSLVRNGLADSIMNSHLSHPDFSDAPMVPASLSIRSVDYIRKELSFAGAVFTDDMQMNAVEVAMPIDAAAVAAVNAENTFLVYSNFRKEDGVDTVEKIGALLDQHSILLDGALVDRQIAAADAFRRKLI